MDYDQLVENLKALGVNPPDIERAALYYNYLVEAKDYFKTTMDAPVADGTPGLGGDYSFVQNAINSSSLLNELAYILDEFTEPAVEGLKIEVGSGTGWTFRKYLNDNVFNANSEVYKNNVISFWTSYPIAQNAVNKLSQNFQNNIFLCCQRVIADRVRLTGFYKFLNSSPNLEIVKLIKIKSTSSDFHKGGKQVLILTFITRENDAKKYLKVIYKPGDIEVDCLIAGKKDAINTPGLPFMNNSLFEIFNNELAAYKEANSGFLGKALDTYGILPIKYNTQNNTPGSLKDNVESYGYIEYINYDPTMLGGTSEYFKSGINDFIITNDMDQDEIVDTFYQKIGAFTVLASTFSITDMHNENLMAFRYKPYPIDLEMSLVEKIDTIEKTTLTGSEGGLTSEAEGNRNRLCTIKDGDLEIIGIDYRNLFTGFNDAMEVLNAAQNKGAFNGWFDRLNNVVVRYFIFSTRDLQQVINQVYNYTLNDRTGRHNPHEQLEIAIPKSVMAQLTMQWEFYKDNLEGTNPNFLAFTPKNSQHDYENLDIPVFYHKIGSKDIFNSLGQKVEIPDEITIFNDENNPTTETIKDSIGNRSDFFVDSPTTANVLPQIQKIGGGTGEGSDFDTRRIELEQSLKISLGLLGVPQNSNSIVPQN